MKCPICGNELEVKNKQIGTDNSGNPVFNEYAVCRDCKKQWNLDKQRAKKAAAKATAQKSENASNVAPKKSEIADSMPRKTAVQKKPATGKVTTKSSSETAAKTEKKCPKKSSEQRQPANSAAQKQNRKLSTKSAIEKTVRIEENPREKVGRKPASSKQCVGRTYTDEEKRYSNIPPERVRSKRKKAVQKGYEEMLATGSFDTDKVTKTNDTRKTTSSKSSKNRDDKYDTKATHKIVETEIDEYDDTYCDDAPRFRAMRILFGIISLFGFGFFTYKGFMTGLSSTTDGDGTGGILYIILALCMLVSALLYFVMQKKNTIFAFLLPMLFYLGSSVFAFLKRGDDLLFLIAAVATGIMAIISLSLAIASRGGSDYANDEENYDETFEDEYADEEYED